MKWACSVTGPVMLSLPAQAAQVRKSSIGGLGLGKYHPNTHHAYTVHSGTNVEQVRFTLCVLVCRLSVTEEMLLGGLCVKPLMQAVLEQSTCVFVAVRLLFLICFACARMCMQLATHILLEALMCWPLQHPALQQGPICLLNVTPGHPELRISPASLIATQFYYLYEQQLSCYCSSWYLSDNFVPCMYETGAFGSVWACLTETLHCCCNQGS